MIRFPPTLITLGNSDLQDFNHRQECIKKDRRAAEEQGKARPTAQSSYPTSQSTKYDSDHPLYTQSAPSLNVEVSCYSQNSTDSQSDKQQVTPTHSSPERSPERSPRRHVAGSPEPASSTSDEYSFNSQVFLRSSVGPGSPENAGFDGAQRQPHKDDFTFGGFLEALPPVDNTPRSSPFGMSPSSAFLLSPPPL